MAETEDLVDRVMAAIRPCIYESEAVADHMHEAAARRAALAAIEATLAWVPEPTWRAMIKAGRR